MNKICPTCGGECALVREDARVKVYKCICCDNVYTVRDGQLFPSENGGSAFGVNSRPLGGTVPRKAEKVVAVGNKNVDINKNVDFNKSVKEVSVPAANMPRELGGEEVYSLCVNSVAEVRAYRGKTKFSGSGYSIGGGYALTNAHVVAEGGVKAKRIEMYACGKSFTAEIAALGSDFPENEDLALLKLCGAPAEFAKVTFADVNLLKNGQQVFVIGNSLGGGTCITGGIISDRRRRLEGKERLMTDCAVNRGNSGGPVFNAFGKVIGTIVAVTTSAEGMNYAIPADIVQQFIENCGLNM